MNDDTLIALIIGTIGQNMDGTEGCGYKTGKAILELVDKHRYKHTENKPMHDREGNYLGEWNGKVESGPQYRTQHPDHGGDVNDMIQPTQNSVLSGSDADAVRQFKAITKNWVNPYNPPKDSNTIPCSECNKPMPQTAVPAESATCGDCVRKSENKEE